MRGRNIRSQEVGVIFSSDLAGKVPGSKLELVPLGSLRREGVGLFLKELQGVGLVDLLSLCGGGVVAGPLPELAAAHFGGCGVLLKRCVRDDKVKYILKTTRFRTMR